MSQKNVSIRKEDLDWAADQGLLDSSQVGPLWAGLASLGRSAEPQAGSRFDLQHLLWYSGAVIVLVAMGWFMTEIWSSFAGAGVIATAIAYAGAFVVAGANLWRKPEMRVPGGILVTLAVGMVPVAVFGLQHELGLWAPHLEGERDLPFLRNIMLEGATILAAALALRFVRFPFLTAPLVLATWLATMDTISWIAGVEGLTWQTQNWITLGFGLLMLSASLAVDRLTKQDFAFWSYLAGATAVWFPLTLLLFTAPGGEWDKALYCGANVLFMLASVFLRRPIFVMFGGAGVMMYLGYLAYAVFQGSILFPFALVALGVVIIFAGVLYHRHHRRLEAALTDWLPSGIRALVPDRG